MRFWYLLLPLTLAACAGGPGALGITGPDPNGAAGTGTGSYGAVALPSPLTDNTTVLAPGVPPSASSNYAPSIVPTYGVDGKYFGY